MPHPDRRYWRRNVLLMTVLLLLWAAAGLGAGILFAHPLNSFMILGGIPLGFWFAQQGSIVAFVVIVFVYALLMNRLDAKHRAATPPGPPAASAPPEAGDA